MRLIYLVLGLAVLAWVIYAFQDSNTSTEAKDAEAAKQQYQKSIDEAKEAADTMQKSLATQLKRFQQSNQ